jgi:anti-anti-sigma regulatory factor
VEVTLEQSEELSVIHLEGAVDIASAAELKKLLLQALGSGHEVRIAPEGATDLDVTAVQLLWAARREAKVLGVKFTFAGRLPDSVTSTLAHAGLEMLATTGNGSQLKEADSCQP